MSGQKQLNWQDDLRAEIEAALWRAIPPYTQVINLTEIIEPALVRFAITRAEHNHVHAGRILGLGRITVARRLDEYGLPRQKPKEETDHEQ